MHGVKHYRILRRFALENKCGNCDYFIGCGDWGLCCTQKYGLTYEDSDACELFRGGLENDGKETNLSKNKKTQL